MNNFVTLPISGACVDFACELFQACLPIREECDGTPTDTLLVDCDEKWNCNLCDTDEPYFIPFISGDKIQIQTLFADTNSGDRTNPDSGFGDWITVRLYNAAGELSDDHTLFASKWLNGWNGAYNYQVIEIDTSLFSDRCWSLEFETSDGITLCTQDFREILCSEPSVTIKGAHEGFDCNGFYYGAPIAYNGSASFQYDNTIRLNADLRMQPGSITKAKVGRKVTAGTVTDNWRLVLAEKIPPFMNALLTKTYLSAPVTVIDGKSLEITTFSARNRINYNRMLLYEADLVSECTRPVGTC